MGILDDLQATVIEHSTPELAKLDAHVYQVWSDGEVTLQKAGPLLWQRTLHSVNEPLSPNTETKIIWPEHMREHGFIYTDEAGVEAVRDALRAYTRTL